MTILAAIALLIGGVWILQGLNVLPGSALRGQSIFAALDTVIVLIAALRTWRVWRPRGVEWPTLGDDPGSRFEI